jgi:rhodanese-related sulfurtransferase
MTVKFISLLVIVLGFISCANNETKSFASVEEMVEDARSNVDIISPADFKKVLEAGEQYYLIDCRESEEFGISCIPGALSVPRGVLEDEIANQAPKKRTTVYIYCDNGLRSAMAATVLPALKYSSVKLIDGGFEAWQQLFPELIENSPVRGTIKKAAAAPSGGCGG